MILEKVEIENFKSIEKIEFEIKKIDNSYTTILLGVNEVGKSNILKAMSFLNMPTEEFDYNLTHNQKDEESEYIDIYFNFSFTNWQKIKKDIIDYFTNKGCIVDSRVFSFELTNFKKNIYLEKTEKIWKYVYSFDIKNLSKNILIIRNENNEIKEIKLDIINTSLNEQIFKNILREALNEIISKYEPKVSFWKPSDKYLISEVDLNLFKNDISSNIPLKHIFALSGYTDNEQIEEQIEKITISQFRRSLMTKLSKNTTDYIKNIWKHPIEIDIEITDSFKCCITIKDSGKDNENIFFNINQRSDGFKQFISFILSLSVESKKFDNKNRLILIDEPERHLHPSGIRDLGKELLEIGKNNYLFVSTHSPFLIDKQNKERHTIIKKNSFANTIKKDISNHEDIRDDEVLNEAFGINMYKDLLLPHNILVEGASDKIILQKLFKLKEITYGITNGTGTNIVQIASKFNLDNINIFVIVDDDKEGKKYQSDIIKIGGVYSNKNVFTLKDLIGKELVSNSTIEDLLNSDFVLSEFKKLIFEDNLIKEKIDSFTLDKEKPYLEQIKLFLQQNKMNKDDISILLNTLKINLSNNFKPTKKYFEDNILLTTLIDKIEEKINLA